MSPPQERQRADELGYLSDLTSKVTYVDAPVVPNDESGNELPTRERESSVLLQPERSGDKAEEQRHVLVKRFNEFVGKRAKTSAEREWRHGAEDELPFGVIGSMLGFNGLHEAANNMNLVSRQEKNLDQVKSGAEGRKRPVTLRQSDGKLLKNYDMFGDMLKGRSHWMESNAVPFGTDTWYGTSSNVNASPILHSAMNTKKYAEFLGKRPLPAYHKRWVDFPGMRPAVPAIKRYAEFLGKRSVATARGALVASLEKEILQDWLSQVLALHS